jgi:hypothetical protein
MRPLSQKGKAMLAAILSSLVTMALTLISSRIYFTKVRESAINKHDELVKPIADEAFLYGFEKGWTAAISEPITVKAAYENLFGKK